MKKPLLVETYIIMKTCILAILCSVFLFSDAFAQSISGTSGVFTHGGSVIISGSNFGVHADNHDVNTGQLCWAWQDFESGLDSDGFTESQSYYGNSHWDIQTTAYGGPHGGSNWGYRFAQETAEGATSNMAGLKKPAESGKAYPGTLFVSYWFKMPYTSSSGKIYRQWAGAGAETDVYYLDAGGDVWCVENSGQHDFRYPDETCNATFEPIPDNVWIRVDYIQTSASSVDFYYIGKHGNAAESSASIAGGSYVQVVIGSGKDGNGGNDYYGYDDIYIDFTQARVEICDTSTWAARTHCEIQIPTSWSASSIGIKVNRGSFGASDSAYLYVVDSTGAVSSGYAVTFGSDRKLNNVTGVRVTLH